MKRSFNQLKTSLPYNRLLNHYHFIALGLIFALITYRNHQIFLIIFIALFFSYLFLKNKSIFYLTLIISIIIVLRIFLFELKTVPVYFQGVGKIINITAKKDYQQMTVKTNKGRFLLNIKNNEYDFILGDQFYFEADIELVSKARLPNLFDYYQYLKDKRILGVLKLKDYYHLKNTFVINKIGSSIASYYDQYFKKESADFLKALILGINEIENDLRTQINQIGISHLFVVSGLHINIIIFILEKIITKLKIKNDKQQSIIICFLFGYLIITAFLISVIRVFLSVVLKGINKRFALGLSSTDQMALNVIIVLLINPLWVYQISFMLTYLISSTLIISQSLLSQYKSLLKSIIISGLSMLISLPIVINIALEINLFSLIFNLLYIPFMTIIFLPFSFIVSFLPFLAPLYQLLSLIFIKITSLLAKIKIGMIAFPKMPLVFALLYYGAFWTLAKGIENKKYKGAIFFGLVLCCWHQLVWFNIYDQIYFLDLHVGEATFIQQSFNQANILIDTGDKFNDEIIIFLKKKGIKRIDYLIITHSDSDHFGQTAKICTEFNVKRLILSSYDKGYHNIDFPSLIGLNQIHYVKKGDFFKIGKMHFDVIHPNKQYVGANNNSIVLNAFIFNHTFLFTGDIEALAEKELIKTFSNKKVNFLKIAHHGSITSSSEAFLKAINYDVAIIMSGYNNTFGFPNQLIVKRLSNKPLLLTKDQTTIVFKKLFFQEALYR